ncbi:MAG: hypothetical protein IT324_21260 [Anaerolineae bacterium]|nr:hypothetical protein [Anaerolineae bacterium]
MRARLILFILAVALAACGKDRPTATPFPTSIPATPSPSRTTAVVATVATIGTLSTLPPTWTPLPSRTPLPTRTPTLSPTPIPTLTAQQICDHFRVVAAPAADAQFDYDSTATFAWQGVPQDVPMTLSITRHGEKTGVRAEIPVAGDSLLSFPLTRLPSDGQYDWKIWLQHPQYGEICAHSGTFTRKPAVLV